MAEEIGSLEIQIQAQATKANNAIDKLITKLDRLSTSLGSINSSSLVGLANGVNRLANSMQGMNNVKTADFTRIATGVKKLANIDTASINRAASAMTQIGKAVNGISVSTGASTQIAELAKGIAQLGYKSSTQAIENIPKLATAMQGLMTTLSKAPTVSQNLINMTNALAKLARTGSSSGKAANSLASSLNFFSNSANRAKTSSFSLAAAFGKLYASYWLLFRAFGKVKEMITLSSSLTEVQNVVDVTFGNMASKVEEFSKTSIQQLGMSELAFKQYASRFQAMGSAMGINPSLIENANSFLSKQTDGYIGLSDSMSDVSINLTKLAADMASFYNVEQSAVAEDLESIFTGMTRPLRAYGLDLTEATLKEWAMKNGLDANIDSMTQAEKTMLRYQYVLANTGAAQGDFARTSDTWANQIRILTENFKALGTIIGSWFVNALKPFVRALNQAMQYVIAFAETVTNALGSIFGWKFEVSGGGVADDWSDSMEDYSDSLGDAADNAKKLNKQLRAFDELNVISQKDSSGSGSGSGTETGGASGAQGQIVPAETIFKDYESNIKNLEQLGNKIRDSLIGALDSIQWENVFEKARNFGTGLADFLNGLLAYDGEGRTLFGKVAKTLANTLNTIVYAAQSFATKFDFYQFGVNLGDALNNFFETFDFKAAADTLNKWVDGLKETIKGFIDTADWGTVWQGIKDFFGELELDTVAVIIGSVLIKRFGAIKIGSAALRWFGQNLANELKTYWGEHNGLSLTMFIKTLGIDLGNFVIANPENWAHLWALFEDNILKGTIFDTNTWDGLPAKVDDAIDNAIDTVGNFLVNAMKETLSVLFNWNETKSLFEQAKESFSKGGVYILEGIAEGFAGAIAFVLEPIKDLFTAIYNGICSVFGIHSPAEEMKPLGENIFLGIMEGFTSMFDTFTEKISEFWESYVSPWFSLEKWTELLGNILIAAQTKWAEITEWWNGTAIVTWWDESVAPWFSLEKWLELLENMKLSFSTKWTETSTQWGTNITTWWDKHVSPWFTKKKWDDVLSKIPQSFKDAFKAAANGAIGFLNNVIGGIEDMVNNAIQALSKMANLINKIPNVNIQFDAPHISFPKIPQFEVGGFPEDGLFMANHNELVGQFSNGKTAVANNEQIIEGIRRAAYEGMKQALAESNGTNVTFKVEGDPNGIFKVVQEESDSYFRRTGNGAFAY